MKKPTRTPTNAITTRSPITFSGLMRFLAISHQQKITKIAVRSPGNTLSSFSCRTMYASPASLYRAKLVLTDITDRSTDIADKEFDGLGTHVIALEVQETHSEVCEQVPYDNVEDRACG